MSAGLLLGLGLTMVLAPLIYKGMAGGAGASKPVFFIVSAMMTWATLAILYTAATKVPALVQSLPLLSKLIMNAVLVLAVVSAVMHSARSLADAVSGDGSGAWNLP